MLIPPIPRGLLCHKASVQTVTNEDKWGNITESPQTALSFVRIEPSDKIKISKEGRQLTLSALLFYDCNNSLPKNQVFSIEDVIIWNDNKYKVESIEPIYGFNKLHHFEIGLVAFYGS